MEQLNQSQNLEPIPRLRAEHVVNEINRVQQFVTALSEGNLSAAGHLMMDSHTSLRDLFEASCPELDHLVEIGTEPDGVWGGRMTGGGFGGCAVFMVDRNQVETVSRHIQQRYFGSAKQPTDIISVVPVQGAHSISISSFPTPESP